MKQNNLKSCIGKFTPQKRRAVAEVISSLLLVVITVVGAVILTAFLNDSFIQGGLAASGSDSTVKTIKLVKYDSRDGGNLLGLAGLNNTSPTDQYLCRASCSSNPNLSPSVNGTEFIVIQIENRSVNPIFLHDVWLGNVTHSWDKGTANMVLDPGGSSIAGDYPVDGQFSILPTNVVMGTTKQNIDNQIESGQTVNLLIKLDITNPDIALSKTIRAQFNIGSNQLSGFLIESGGAQ
jgi:flagellin-like protein